MGKRGQYVWTDGADEEALARGVYDTYTGTNLRYSQVAPLDMFTEANTKSNLPAQIELMAAPGSSYHFQFMAKGGGSANKTYLFQETKALLNEKRLSEFLAEKIAALGTAACPPYHLAIVIGGLSAEMTLKTVKYASTRYYDSLPTSGSPGGRAFRDLEMEQKVHELTQTMGIGAQFGGKYFCHDVRIVRLPRHGASCPVGIGVSCSADRQALGRIDAEGVWLEELEADPARFLPEIKGEDLSGEVVQVDLNQPMATVLDLLTQYPVTTRLSLTGTLVVARDIAHAKLKERLDAGEGLPEYMRNHAVYYAGPKAEMRRPRRPPPPPTTPHHPPRISHDYRHTPVTHASLLVRHRPRQDARGYGLGLVRSDHCGAHGLVRGHLPGGGGVQGDAGQREPLQTGHQRMQEAWRILLGLHRGPCGHPCEELHQEDGGAPASDREHHGGIRGLPYVRV